MCELVNWYGHGKKLETKFRNVFKFGFINLLRHGLLLKSLTRIQFRVVIL